MTPSSECFGVLFFVLVWGWKHGLTTSNYKFHPKISFLRSLWSDLVFGSFAYVCHGSSIHLQNKLLIWNCYLLEKIFSFPYTLTLVVQDEDILFTDILNSHVSTAQPAWIQFIKLKDFRDISLKDVCEWNPFPCCSLIFGISNAFPSCFPEANYGLSTIPPHKPGTLPKISAAKGGECNFLPQETELPVQMFNVYSSLRICAK